MKKTYTLMFALMVGAAFALPQTELQSATKKVQCTTIKKAVKCRTSGCNWIRGARNKQNKIIRMGRCVKK